MTDRLPIPKSEIENPGEVFNAIAALRVGAQAQRAAYRESVRGMGEFCGQLRGVEVFLSGRLEGRGGTRVHRDDPNSIAERLHVRISSAQVETYEGDGELITRNLPYIGLTAWTVEANELVVAYLGIGEFGVSAELAESSPIQA